MQLGAGDEADATLAAPAVRPGRVRLLVVAGVEDVGGGEQRPCLLVRRVDQLSFVGGEGVLEQDDEVDVADAVVVAAERQ
jgi:hypothetical protein